LGTETQLKEQLDLADDITSPFSTGDGTSRTRFRKIAIFAIPKFLSGCANPNPVRRLCLLFTVPFAL